MTSNFGWFIEEKIAVMGRPGSLNFLEDDLLFLRRTGIDTIISLTMAPISEYEIERFSFEATHIPIPDGGTPTIKQIEQFISAVKKCMAGEKKLVVHCGAGYGRSGTMLACYLVETGFTSEKAIKRVREFRAQAIETKAQEKCVADYEFYLLRKRLTDDE